MQVRSLIEDIRDVRFHKVETNLETLTERAFALKVYILCPFVNLLMLHTINCI